MKYSTHKCYSMGRALKQTSLSLIAKVALRYKVECIVSDRVCSRDMLRLRILGGVTTCIGRAEGRYVSDAQACKIER